jgi:hypothetical protein
MTLEEARRQLNVPESATLEELRRAYLRGLKKYKPELDPAGFRNHREAYEFLSFTEVQRQRGVPQQPPSPVAVEPAPPQPAPPQPAPPQTLPEDHPGRRWGRIIDHANEGNWVAVEQAMKAEFDLAQAGRDAVPAALALNLLLNVYASPSTNPAQLGLAFRQWIERNQLEISFSLNGRGEQWLLARELFELPEKFPLPVRCVLAMAILSGDFERTWKELASIGQSFPEHAATATSLLSDKAPLLHSNFTAALNASELGLKTVGTGLQELRNPVVTAPGPQKRSGSSAWIGIAVMAGLSSVSSLLKNMSDAPLPHMESISNPPMPKLKEPRPPLSSELDAWTFELCNLVQSSADPEPCRLAKVATEGFKLRDCSRSAGAIDDLSTHLQALEPLMKSSERQRLSQLRFHFVSNRPVCMGNH